VPVSHASIEASNFYNRKIGNRYFEGDRLEPDCKCSGTIHLAYRDGSTNNSFNNLTIKMLQAIGILIQTTICFNGFHQKVTQHNSSNYGILAQTAKK
jgi:hypothetical protein